MNKKPTVTIGIPAYNEEANIRHLLNALLKQKQEKFVLNQIIVVSDASRDKTEEVVRSFKNKKVKLIKFATRRGQRVAQNRILSEASSDILVLMEADTLPFSKSTIQKLIEPLIRDKSLVRLRETHGRKSMDEANKPASADFRSNGARTKIPWALAHGASIMSVGKSVAVKPTSFVEKVLYASHELKADVFGEWKKGVNVYSARGQAMKALTSKFYRSFRWPNDVPEDSYVFLKVKESGMGITFVEEARAYFRLPGLLKDRIKHNTKFYSGMNALYKYFSEELLETEYKVPFRLIIKQGLIHFLTSPVWTILAISESILMKAINGKKNGFKTIYPPLLSTKNLAV